MYYSPEGVAELFAETRKVCALCDANFPTSHIVPIKSIDGKDAPGTYIKMSDSTYSTYDTIKQAVDRV